MYSASASRLVAYRSESGVVLGDPPQPVPLVPVGRPGQVLLLGEERGDLRGGVGSGKVGHAILPGVRAAVCALHDSCSRTS